MMSLSNDRVVAVSALCRLSTGVRMCGIVLTLSGNCVYIRNARSRATSDGPDQHAAVSITPIALDDSQEPRLLFHVNCFVK